MNIYHRRAPRNLQAAKAMQAIATDALVDGIGTLTAVQLERMALLCDPSRAHDKAIAARVTAAIEARRRQLEGEAGLRLC